MDSRMTKARSALQIAIGLMAALAGLDKFFNLLADWPAYVAPAAAGLLPFSAQTFMQIVGVIEFAVGVTILFVRPAIGAYVASVWLLLVAGNLLLGGHFDIAVRDVVLSVAAFTLARLYVAPQTAGAPVLGARREALTPAR